MAISTVCPRCRTAVCVQGQRLCAGCRAADKRRFRARAKAGLPPLRSPRSPAGDEGNDRGTRLDSQISPDPPRSPGGGIAPPPDWRGAFLTEYAARGGFFRSAVAAGVSSSFVSDTVARDPDFAAQAEQARQLFADTLEDRMVRQAEERGNPVGYIVRLKALRPAEYIERHATLSLYADLSPGNPEDARQMLTAMLGSLTPATRLALVAPADP